MVFFYRNNAGNTNNRVYLIFFPFLANLRRIFDKKWGQLSTDTRFWSNPDLLYCWDINSVFCRNFATNYSEIQDYAETSQSSRSYPEINCETFQISLHFSIAIYQHLLQHFFCSKTRFKWFKKLLQLFPLLPMLCTGFITNYYMNSIWISSLRIRIVIPLDLFKD